MDNPFVNKKLISFCTGMRGLERGLERAFESLSRYYSWEVPQAQAYKIIDVAAYVEIEAFLVWNLVEQMDKGVLDPAPIWTDVKTFPAAAFHRRIHWITAGYPCPPFSTAGNRKGTEDPRHIWPSISKSVEAIRPLGCFFENVSGHLSLGFEEVYRSLVDMDYRVEAGLFTASEVGATHKRERLFILALDNSYYRQLIGASRGFSGEEEQKGLQQQHQGQEPCQPTEMGNSSCIGVEQRERSTFSTGRDTFIDASTKLGDSESDNERSRSGHVRKIESGRSDPQKLVNTKSVKRRLSKHKERKGIDTTRTSEDQLGDSSKSGSQREEFFNKPRITTEPGGKELANTLIDGNPSRHAKKEKGGKGETKITDNNRRRTELADTTESRLQREDSTRQSRGRIFTGPNEPSRRDRWPARPGKDQYEWESARVESRLGFRINGYNFREDLLRMAGNAVVEQQAERAFIELWSKALGYDR